MSSTPASAHNESVSQEPRRVFGPSGSRINDRPSKGAPPWPCPARLGPDRPLFWRDERDHVTTQRGERPGCAPVSTGAGYVQFHDLPHVGLIYAAVTGATIRELQAIAGHTSPKMALRYQRAEIDYLAAVADNVSKMIESGTRR